MSLPSKWIDPASGGRTPPMSDSSVDFPAPLGPTMPRAVPALDGEGHVLGRHDAAEPLRQATDLEHRAHARLLTSMVRGIVGEAGGEPCRLAPRIRY